MQAVLSQVQPSLSLSEGKSVFPLQGQVVAPFALDLSDIQIKDYDDLVTHLFGKY